MIRAWLIAALTLIRVLVGYGVAPGSPHVLHCSGEIKGNLRESGLHVGVGLYRNAAAALVASQASDDFNKRFLGQLIVAPKPVSQRSVPTSSVPTSMEGRGRTAALTGQYCAPGGLPGNLKDLFVASGVTGELGSLKRTAGAESLARCGHAPVMPPGLRGTPQQKRVLQQPLVSVSPIRTLLQFHFRSQTEET